MPWGFQTGTCPAFQPLLMHARYGVSLPFVSTSVGCLLPPFAQWRFGSGCAPIESILFPSLPSSIQPRLRREGEGKWGIRLVIEWGMQIHDGDCPFVQCLKCLLSLLSKTFKQEYEGISRNHSQASISEVYWHWTGMSRHPVA